MHSSQLLIIGNGFDLHCGLKSAYKDFFQSTILDTIGERFGLQQMKAGVSGFWETLLFGYYTTFGKVNYNWCDIETIIKNTVLCILVLFVFINFWDYKNLHDYKFVDIKSPLLTAQQVSNDKENDILVFLKWDYVPYIAYYKEKLNITFKHAVCLQQWFFPEEFDTLPEGHTYYFAMSVYDKDPNCLTAKYKKRYLLRLLNWAEKQKDYKLYTDNNLNVLIRFSK